MRAQRVAETHGNRLGADFNHLGVGSRKLSVYGLNENLQPSFKMSRRQLLPHVKLHVNLKGISSVPRVIPSLEQHRLPKISDHRQVMFEIEFRYVAENVSDHIVGESSLIEPSH